MKLVETALINHQDMLYKIAMKYVKQHEDALDVLQETAYKAIKYAHKVQHEEYVLTWLVRILINNCLSFLKKKQKFITVEWQDTFILEEDTSIDVSLELNDLLMAINPKYCEVIILKYIEGYKIKEIAQAMNKSENTIKTWIRRGMDALRKEAEYGSTF